MRRTKRLIPILAGLLTAAFGIVGAASASTAGATASRPGAPPAVGHLSGVWCTSPSNCMAVGGTSGPASGQSLAEQWNGKDWGTTAAPLLNVNKDLSAVACPQRTMCQAVGSIGAERWNGTAWTVEKTPSSVSAPGFNSVSCPTSSDCVAVGQRGFHSVGLTLAETWNGSAWSVHNPVNPSGALEASLSSVWCVSTSDCIAVGSYEYSSNDYATLAELWNGSTWKLLAAPAQSSTDSFLTGVSCASATSCVAVGSTNPDTLAESWNGSTWTVLPAPPGGPSSIWCTKTGTCMTVGGATAASWNGSAWTALKVPNASATLNGVSCNGASACMAVGTAADSGDFSMLWNGSAWKPHRVNQIDQLAGLSCPKASHCMAVGNYITRSARLATLAESWNGSSWRKLATPAPPGGALADVSCTSASACMAVGSINGALTLAEEWNGTSWRVTPTPSLPAGSQEYGVSCRGRMCMAVGRSMTTELWDGSSWQVQTLPLPSTFYSGELTDVSCATATYCLVTGFYFPSVQANSASFAELWNGTKWRLLNAPGGGLNTVSCLTTTFCMGLTGTGGEIWNGTRWQGAGSFAGSFGFGPGIVAVSCASKSACLAAGNYLAAGGPQLIAGYNVAEYWNGSSWKRLSPAGPGGGMADAACSSRTGCMAAGFTPAGQLGDHTLAELWNGVRWRLLATRNP